MNWILARLTGVLVPVLTLVLTGPLLAIIAAAPAQAQADYQIHAGDTLHIEVLEDASLNRSVLVAPDGRISMPLAGTIKASGQSVETLQATLAGLLAPDFAATPNVYVSIEKLAVRVPGNAAPAAATIDVFVIGEAAKAGKLSVAPGTTLLQIFAEMGGFSQFAAIKRIQLRRMNATTGVEDIYTYNYRAIEQGTSTAGNTVLADGDVIVVPQRGLFE